MNSQDPSHKKLFLLMSVLTQTFFTFVSIHLMPFSFFSAWHNYFLTLVLTSLAKVLAGLKAGIL